MNLRRKEVFQRKRHVIICILACLILWYLVTSMDNLKYIYSLRGRHIHGSSKESFDTKEKTSEDYYGNFQLMVDNRTLVYVGYYDDREEQPMVKVNSLIPGGEKSQFKCVIHYPDKTYTEVVAEMKFVYPLEAYIECPVDAKRGPPLFVMLSIKGMDHHPTTVTVKPPSKKHNTLTRCLRPLVNNYDDINQLIWNIEFLKILGVDKQIFYLNSQSERILNILQMYEEEGFVELRSFSLEKLPIKPPRTIQTSSIHDCLLSEMKTTKYLAFTDLDEVILPRAHMDIVEMADFLFESANGDGKLGSLRFLLAFHPTYLNATPLSFPGKDIAEKYRIQPLLYTHRYLTQGNFIGPKSILKPMVVFAAGAHSVSTFMGGYKELVVDDDIGTVNHYRNAPKYDLTSPLYSNTDIYRFSDVLINAVKERFRKFKIQP